MKNWKWQFLVALRISGDWIFVTVSLTSNAISNSTICGTLGDRLKTNFVLSLDFVLHEFGFRGIIKLVNTAEIKNDSQRMFLVGWCLNGDFLK